MSTALVTGGTKKDIDAMAVLALNIKDVSPEIADELVIYHDGVSSKVMDKFNRIMPTRFIRYRCPIPKWKLWRNETIRYFSQMIFCKYECLRLMNEYDTVIWSDYDVLIREDVSELTKGSSSFSFICDTESKLKDMFHKNLKMKYMSSYDMAGECICTPLFVLHRDKWDYESWCNWCYQQTEKLSKYLYLPEQCIFTMLVQKENILFDRIDKKMYYTHPKDADEKVKILHAYGQPKFWNGLVNDKWQAYYEEWRQM